MADEEGATPSDEPPAAAKASVPALEFCAALELVVDALDAAAVENGGVQRLRRRALVLLPRARGGGQEDGDIGKRGGAHFDDVCVEDGKKNLRPTLSEPHL